MVLSYHLSNVKFKRLTPNYGNGKKLKITYKSVNGKTNKVIYEDDKHIFIDNIVEIENAVYGKKLNWKNRLSFNETIKMTTQWYEMFYKQKNMSRVTFQQIKEYEKKL